MEEGKNYRHIIRIVNTDLDGAKLISHALTKIKGVGTMFANMACGLAKVDKFKKAGSLDDHEIQKLNDIVANPGNYDAPTWMYNRRKDPETGEDKHLTAADLKFMRENDIKMMKKMRTYRGVRHMSGLPVRGQRTKSNFRKNKGKVTGVKRKAVKSGRV